MTKPNDLTAIRGIGNDILAVSKMRQSIERQGQPFLNRLFTEKEQAYCSKFKDSVPHFAGRFAAKEAIAKAFGTGFGSKVHWKEIEVLNDERGKPIVILSEALQNEFHSPSVHISISHCGEYATAVAIWIGPS